MILQRMIWPDKSRPETTELYYHADAPVKITEEGARLPASAAICFDTYFNAFDFKKWKRYTIINEVLFRIRLNGAGIVKLMGTTDAPVAEQEYSGRQEICFAISGQTQDYYYLSLQTQTPTVIEAGTIETKAAGNNVKLALIICTYNRPKELLQNITLLKQQNQAAADGTKVLERIYVVDNAENLNREAVEGPGIFLIPNQNTGGAGGFTRGMREAMKQQDITHLLLMDDDVKIEFEAFERTKSLLKFIKKEYENNFIGGAMFRTDVPYILHAAGESWADGHIINPYKSTDVRTMQQVIRTSQELELEQPYAGWWYCCIPRKHVERSGYPLPFFLHVDDVEYSLRSQKPPLYLNGIAVWHEEFEDKRSSMIEYYDTRNRLITNAIYKNKHSLPDAVYILCERFYATVFRYRYKDFALSVKAVEDFLRGPEWLIGLDSENYHKSLAGYGYTMQDTNRKPPMEYPSKNRFLVIGRYFLPAFSSRVIRMGAPVSAYSGKKKVLLIEPKSQKGFEVKKSWRETGRCIGKLIAALGKLLFCYKKAAGKWIKTVRQNC